MADSNKHDPKENASGGFKVEDKRLFNADGTPVADPEIAQSGGSEESKESEEKNGARDRPDSSRKESGKVPIDFSTFVLSLATTAMANLGEVPDPATGKPAENLDAAQQIIDILTMLQAKTRGNLEPDEDDLIENLLYELRMKYLAKAKVIQL